MNEKLLREALVAMLDGCERSPDNTHYWSKKYPNDAAYELAYKAISIPADTTLLDEMAAALEVALTWKPMGLALAENASNKPCQVREALAKHKLMRGN